MLPLTLPTERARCRSSSRRRTARPSTSAATYTLDRRRHRPGHRPLRPARRARSIPASSPALDGGVSRRRVRRVAARHRRHASPATCGRSTRSPASTPATSTCALTGRANPNDAIRVRRFAANPAGTTLVALGNFTAVAGQAREPGVPGRPHDVAEGDARAPGTPPASTSPAATDPHVQPRASTSRPTARYFVIVTTGGPRGTVGPLRRGGPIRDLGQSARSSSRPGSTGPAATASTASRSPAWPCTSAATSAGSTTPTGRNSAGPGAVSRPGIGAIDPVTGPAPLRGTPPRRVAHGTEKLYATAGRGSGSAATAAPSRARTVRASRSAPSRSRASSSSNPARYARRRWRSDEPGACRDRDLARWLLLVQVGQFALAGLIALAIVGLATAVASRRIGEREAVSGRPHDHRHQGQGSGRAGDRRRAARR